MKRHVGITLNYHRRQLILHDRLPVIRIANDNPNIFHTMVIQLPLAYRLGLNFKFIQGGLAVGLDYIIRGGTS